jgi:hypothetical protein
MLRYFRLRPSLFFLLLIVYVVWEWVQWARSTEKVMPSWRAGIAVAGFCFATFSMALSVFLFAHASFTGGYPFYHPVELFCIRFGSLTALLGLLASIVGKGKLRLHVAVISILNLLFWFTDAAVQ